MPIRIGGLASGMDIDSIVNDLMRVERLKVDKAVQNRTLLEWTREKYNEVNKMFANFVLNTRNAFGLMDSSSGTIVNRSVSSLKWIKSASASDPGVADVSARSNALNGSYTFTVHQLASNWSSASKEAITVEGGDNSSIRSQFGLNDNDLIYFTITTNAGSKNEGKIRVYINKNEASFRINNETGEHKITLEGKNLSNISLKEIADQITKADIGVTAVYDSSIDRFFLQTNATGEQSTIELSDLSSHDFFGSLLKLQYEGEGGETQDVKTNVRYTGKDAVVDFGMAKGIKKSSNQFTINNIDFNLKQTGSTTIRVDTDEDAVIEKVREFVNQYNELIDKLDKILGEKRYSSYAPLTSEQKEAMTEKEIELWEEKAKSGLLRNDILISSTMQNMRLGLYQKVEGTSGSFSHLTQIGIETESYVTGSMGGKLKLDENRLREAIRADIDGVIELLFKEPDKEITDENAKRSSTGLVGRMYGDIINGMKQIIVKAGPGDDSQLYRSVNYTMLIDFVTEHSSISMLDKSINDYSKRILELETRLMRKEEAYWKQFTAMEKALNEMYSQSMWLAQQMGMY